MLWIMAAPADMVAEARIRRMHGLHGDLPHRGALGRVAKMAISFKRDKGIACELCVPTCTYNAMEIVS